MPELGTTTRPKARKPHNCDQCGCTIQPGETYARSKWLDAGVFSSSVTCTPCDDLANELYDRGFDDDGYLPYLPELDDWPAYRHDWPELADRIDAYHVRVLGRLS